MKLTLCMLVALPAAQAASAALDVYATKCHQCFSAAFEKASTELEDLRQTVEQGSCVPGFGEKADSICNQALERFNNAAPDAGDDASMVSVYDKKVDELERTIDTTLRLLYLKQLNLLRDKALTRYKSAAKASESSDYQSMVSADAFFTKEAEASTRQGADWDYATERAGLQATMNELAQRSRRLVDVQLKAAQQQSSYMQLFQMYQQQIQQLQQAQYGQPSPWNVGLAYRVPDTNINLSGAYQQGRTNVQLSCVPDDSAPLLGPNGFTRGVGPGNLGVSVNMNF